MRFRRDIVVIEVFFEWVVFELRFNRWKELSRYEELGGSVLDRGIISVKVLR